MSSRYKVMHGCECCISSKSMHSSLLSWRDHYFKNSRISAKIIKTEGLGKSKFTYIQIIKYSHATWATYLCQSIRHVKKQQCVKTHIKIMYYHTGNFYCDVLPNVLAEIFLTRKQMISISTPVLQFVFTFII